MTTTYHGDAKFKAAFVSECVKHRKADAFVRGTYHREGEVEFRGCSIGCSVHSLQRLGKNGMGYGDHEGAANALGWPEWLMRLQDTLFEGLPLSDYKTWTERLAKAVPVGVRTGNMEQVKHRFLAFVMSENLKTVLGLKIAEKLKTQIAASIEAVRELHERAIRGGKIGTREWSAAANATYAANAAAANATYAANAAAAAANAAAANAYAANATYAADARGAMLKKLAANLIRLLKSA